MAASYESSVKETLATFATRHHSQFSIYVQNQYEKLNSRVSLSDLFQYAKLFDIGIHTKFKQIIDQRKKEMNARVGKDFTQAYQQILNWRHDFAHAGVRHTTVEEALITHRLGKRVLYAFDDAFN